MALHQGSTSSTGRHVIAKLANHEGKWHPASPLHYVSVKDFGLKRREKKENLNDGRWGDTARSSFPRSNWTCAGAVQLCDSTQRLRWKITLMLAFHGEHRFQTLANTTQDEIVVREDKDCKSLNTPQVMWRVKRVRKFTEGYSEDFIPLLQ